nr:hypothetical protein [Actinomycetota bacterium]
MARRALGVPVLLLVSLAATGWLYLVQPALPGPRIGGVLPLDELARRSAAPLLSYLLVWGVAAALLGLYARWARLERLTAALLLGGGVGLLGYLQSGLSLAIVRQISLRVALDHAARLQPIYLSAA